MDTCARFASSSVTNDSKLTLKDSSDLVELVNEVLQLANQGQDYSLTLSNKSSDGMHENLSVRSSAILPTGKDPGLTFSSSA